MSNYPLFPELPEPAKEEAQQLIDKFKMLLKRAADEVLGEVYSDIIPHIESDSWTNFRNALMAGLRGYNNRLVQGEYDFRAIREKIFADYREDILKDLDQDNLKRIAELQKEVSRLQDIIESRPHGRSGW